MPPRLRSITRRRMVVLAVIVLAAGAMRVGWVLQIGDDTGRLTSPDSPSYLESSAALLENGRFDESPDGGSPMFVRTPGYPMFLAAERIVVGDSLRSLAILQAALSVITILLVHALTRRLFDDRAALVAAVLAAFDPLLFWASGTLLTESLHAQFLILVALAFAWALEDGWGGASRWALVGTAIAAATHVRPSTYFLPLLLIPALCLVARRREIAWGRTVVSMLALALPIVVLVGGWQIRNAQVVDSSRFSGIEAMSMYFYRAGGVLAEASGQDFVEVRNRLRDDYEPLSAAASQGPYYDEMYDRGLDIVLEHPVELALITAKGLVSESFGVSTTIFPYLGIEQSPALVAIARLSVAGFWVLAAIGFISAVRRPNPARATALLCGLLVVYLLVVSAGPEAYSRFRTPVMPILCCFAGAGLVELARRSRRSMRDSATSIDQQPRDSFAR